MKAQKERLFRDVAFLSGLVPARNFKNIESLDKASAYIRKAFENTGLPVVEQKWNARGKEYKNIIASFNPGKLKRFIAGAHYDVAGDQPGADDNASGVAGLLETARMITEDNPETEYGIDFVAYCLEEPPFFGSEEMGSNIHARSLFERMTPVIGMVCFDMIGYFSEEKDSQRFPDKEMRKLYPNTGSFIAVVGIEKHRKFNEKFKMLMTEGSGIDVQVISLPGDNVYANLSDQRNYRPYGYKAVMINDTADFRNDNYHEPTDTIDTLDFDMMTEVVDGAYKALIGIR